MTAESSHLQRELLVQLRRRVVREAAVVGVATAALGVASLLWQLPLTIVAWSQVHLGGVLDDAVLLLAGSHLFMLVFGARRATDLKREFTRRRQAETELLHRARHDVLTGLLNRAALTEELEAAVHDAAIGGTTTGVILIDLDRFKEVNDTLGHDVGDSLLQAVAARLTGELRADATLARLGGDEFVVLVRDCAGEDAQLVAQRLQGAIRRPFQINGIALEIDGSLGVAHWRPGSGVAARGSGPDLAARSIRATELLREADIAMYAAKREHSGVGVYRPDLDVHNAESLAVYGDLRRGIRAGELRVHYQPKVALADGRTLGVEALVRWQHPRRGLLTPADFVDIAEQTGLIGELTDAVLDQAMADCSNWRRQGLELPVAVNLSARSLVDSALPDRIAERLASHALPASFLELEITESAAMQDPQRALQVLSRLRDGGLRLAVDDYGTGQASLAYLTRLPVSSLKIDRSFVTMMELDANDQTIVRSTIDLAHNLGLRVIAEGVETRQTWQALRALNCDEAQGYWLGRPCPAAEVPDLIAAIGVSISATPSAVPTAGV